MDFKSEFTNKFEKLEKFTTYADVTNKLIKTNINNKLSVELRKKILNMNKNRE